MSPGSSIFQFNIGPSMDTNSAAQLAPKSEPPIYETPAQVHAELVKKLKHVEEWIQYHGSLAQFRTASLKFCRVDPFPLIHNSSHEEASGGLNDPEKLFQSLGPTHRDISRLIYNHQRTLAELAATPAGPLDDSGRRPEPQTIHTMTSTQSLKPAVNSVTQSTLQSKPLQASQSVVPKLSIKQNTDEDDDSDVELLTSDLVPRKRRARGQDPEPIKCKNTLR